MDGYMGIKNMYHKLKLTYWNQANKCVADEHSSDALNRHAMMKVENTLKNNDCLHFCSLLPQTLADH